MWLWGWPVFWRWNAAMIDLLSGDIVHPPRPEDHRGEVVQGLPHGPVQPRHLFEPEKWVPAHKTLTRLAQTERTCSVCGVVKVTVHEEGGGARREWRATAHGEQGEDEIECTGMVEMDSTA